MLLVRIQAIGGLVEDQHLGIMQDRLGQADATPAELEARSRYHQAVSLTATDTRAAREALSRVADVAAIEVDAQDGRITAFPKPGKQIFVAVNQVLQERNIVVRELALEGGRLDEVFRTITQGRAQEAQA